MTAVKCGYEEVVCLPRQQASAGRVELWRQAMDDDARPRAGPKRTAVALEPNPRAISQMANVSSNNPPGVVATSPVPATPNSSSSEPAAKHA